jgi:hypothetical protein
MVEEDRSNQPTEGRGEVMPFRTRSLLFCLGILGLFGVSQASAQVPNFPQYGPYSRPQLNPYLNLIRGQNAGVNYFLGTIPEQQRRAQYQQLRTGINTLDLQLQTQRSAEQATAGEPSVFNITPLQGGHPTYFMNYSHYYSFGQSTQRTGLPGTQQPGALRPGSR